MASGSISNRAKKYGKGDLDGYKEKDGNIYTHLLLSLWKGSKYDSKLRELSTEELLNLIKGLYILRRIKS
ncbi:hypothetical protein CSV71_01200 [Sporosarcina sp. P21c]|nr:hypothetical protein CSV78_00380 [Sporosarcina sp. P16a]PIC91257.1 hypothetical protein CSV71_01200 [Sporosarcina sp. P21c]PIC93610.1 hypothetical protein CSV70_03720 [Sporosarcina sp. P25]